MAVARLVDALDVRDRTGAIYARFMHDHTLLQQLEESLWRGETRFDTEYMHRVLSPDFFEFGRSGRIHKRADTLAHKSEPINATFPLKNFTVHEITADVVLITYVSEVQYDEEIEVGNRSSLWIKQGDTYQLKFHQGTVVN